VEVFLKVIHEPVPIPEETKTNGGENGELKTR
jgi:hypothetical protein